MDNMSWVPMSREHLEKPQSTVYGQLSADAVHSESVLQ